MLVALGAQPSEVRAGNPTTGVGTLEPPSYRRGGERRHEMSTMP